MLIISPCQDCNFTLHKYCLEVSPLCKKKSVLQCITINLKLDLYLSFTEYAHSTSKRGEGVQTNNTKTYTSKPETHAQSRRLKYKINIYKNYIKKIYIK